MQSSMWKLLTAAGIIGIGTMVVLEVQNRLPVPAHASNTPEGAPAFPGKVTEVVPDASADLDLILAGMEANGQPPFALREPGQTNPPVSAAENPEFVGVTPVNRTVLKDTLTDDINPFDRSFEADSDSTLAATPDEGMNSRTSATPPLTPASFAGESAPKTTVTPNSANKSSSTLFFNGGNQEKSQAKSESKSAGAPVIAAPAPTPTGQVVPAATQVFSDTPKPETTTPAVAANKTVDRTSFTSVQQDADTPELFLPDFGPEPGTQSPPRSFPPTDPSTDPSTNPSTDTPLMETPGFEADPAPVFDSSTPPVKPGDSGGSPGNAAPSSGPDFSEDPPNFTQDDPVPTPPAGTAGTPPNSTSDSLPPFEPDPTPEAPRQPPRGQPDTEFPAPSYPDRNGFPDLDEKSPFEGSSKPDELSEPFDLPTIDNRPGKTLPDGSGSGGSVISADRTMSKVMRPQLSIQKRAPETATVGVTHEYTIIVSNDGDSPAYDVVVDDELGNGAKLVNSRPTADYDRVSGKLSWSIRELAPKAKEEIVVRITPSGEGTLDGIATVRFKAQVKSATIITAPKLTLEMTGPAEVKVGDEVQLRYVIRNNGSGDASNVILRSVLPPGLKHSEGGDLEYEIEILAAGDREEINLTVVAAEPGRFRTVSEVTASGVSADKATTDIDIIGSQLTIQRLGPDRRFVGRSAKFQNIIANETKFEANNAVVIEQVPEGMRFVSADNGGEYSPQTGRIRWEIPRLASGKQTVLEVELEAQTAGQQQTVVEVVESAGFRSQATENTVVTVEDYENMTADISRQDAPVAIGETFGFTITIENRGTAVARGVEMTIEVPSEIDIKAAGTINVPARRQGNTVRYAIVEEIQPGKKMAFELKLQGQHAARNAVVRASLKYEKMTEPLIVSESVTVFDDRP